jgi:hypothetical protein
LLTRHRASTCLLGFWRRLGFEVFWAVWTENSNKIDEPLVQ